MSGDSILGWFKMFLPLTLIWILSSTTVECQVSNVFGGYHYVFYGSPIRSFSAARAHCQRLGGDLPIITSADQNDFIAMRITEGNGRYYIGLVEKNGTYRWIDGTAPQFRNWDHKHLYIGETHQPASYCAVMRSQSGNPVHGLWDLVACTSQRRNICQIPIGVPIGVPIVPTPSSSPTVSSPPKSNSATAVGSAVGAIVVIVIVIILIIIFYKRRSDESATTSSPQYENPVFDQSETNVHTYLELDTDSQSYAYPTNYLPKYYINR